MPDLIIVKYFVRKRFDLAALERGKKRKELLLKPGKGLLKVPDIPSRSRIRRDMTGRPAGRRAPNLPIAE